MKVDISDSHINDKREARGRKTTETDPASNASQSRREDSNAAHSGEDFREASLAAIIEHITTTHHAYLRAEFPRVSRMLERLIAVSGSECPKLLTLGSLFGSLRHSLEPHMLKEEAILFPCIRQVERAETPSPTLFEALVNVSRMMEREHKDTVALLSGIRELTLDYSDSELTDLGCLPLMESLERMERDTLLHIREEAGVLFPRARCLTEQKSAG